MPKRRHCYNISAPGAGRDPSGSPAATKLGEYLFSGACTGQDPATGQLAQGADRQAVQAFKNLRALVERRCSSSAPTMVLGGRPWPPCYLMASARLLGRSTLRSDRDNLHLDYHIAGKVSLEHVPGGAVVRIGEERLQRRV